MDPDVDLSWLQAQILELLGAALAAEERHAAEASRMDSLHVDELQRRDQLHIDELARRDDLHSHEIEMLNAALTNRDVIGQAKGIIMASLGCSPDEAFRLLAKQSMMENRKVFEVAAEIAERAQARRQ